MKKKKKYKKFIFSLIIIALIIGSILCLKEMHIKNIYIVGNNYLTDQEIIELAGISNYPKLFKLDIKKKIKINPLIKDVKVKRNIFGKITISIEEYNLLLKDEVNNTIYLSNNKTIANDSNYLGIPILTNVVEKDILNSFLTKLNEIDKDILSKISEINYTPNEYDDDLFLFMMNDGNYVYITTKKLTSINKYESVVNQLEGKKGIIYLDSGNHFEVLN